MNERRVELIVSLAVIVAIAVVLLVTIRILDQRAHSDPHGPYSDTKTDAMGEVEA